MIVTPGKQFTTQERHNTTNTNLLGIPSITLEDGEVTNAKIATGIDGSKITNIPVSSLSSETQSKFGVKNYAANPAFEYWPYGTSFTTAGSEVNVASGWTVTAPSGLSYTLSQQNIVAGISDTLLLDSKYFARLQTTSTNATGIVIKNYIPNVREFSGQTMTISAVVQNISGTLPALTISATQYFGTGGSPSSSVVTTSSSVSVTNTWTKISATLTLPSISGKTVGTNADDALVIAFNFANSSTQFYFDIANFQVETSTAATSFENAISKQWQLIEQNIANCSGRLTLQSGTPIMSSNVTGATSVYWTPFNGNQIPLWNGYRWQPTPSAEVAISLSGFAASTIFDVFAVLSSSNIVTFETLAWYSATARATALAYYDGILCKSGEKKRRYIGSFMTNSTGGQASFIMTGSAAGGQQTNICIDNAYNRIELYSTNQDTTASWTYASTAFRQVNASTANSTIVLNAVPGEIATIEYQIYGFPSHSVPGIGSLGKNSTTTPVTGCRSTYTSGATASYGSSYTTTFFETANGYATYNALEASPSGTVTYWTSGYSTTNYGFNGLVVRKRY